MKSNIWRPYDPVSGFLGRRARADDAGATREHHFIRAETHGGKSDAEDFSIIKGKKIVDEFGDRMFEK